MLYTPITLAQYLEEKMALREEMRKLRPFGVEFAVVQGRLEMLDIVIEDLKIILAGPVEI